MAYQYIELTKTMVTSIHWLAFIWVIVLIALSAWLVFENQKARKNKDDNKQYVDRAYNLSITILVFMLTLVLPFFWWSRRETTFVDSKHALTNVPHYHKKQ